VISLEERRRRLMIRQRLTPAHRTDDVAQIARDLVGLHATDPATIYLSAVARMAHPSIDAIDRALHDDRSVVRMHGMRMTIFAVARDHVPMVQRSCTDHIVERERAKLAALLEQQEIAGDGRAWIERVSEATIAALEIRGEALARELSRDVPELSQKLRFGGDAKWAGEMGISTRILFLLGAGGRIVRTRPRGTWVSSQYRWSSTRAWLGAPVPEMDAGAARTGLLRAWLATYGPATFTDMKWWTGWRVRDTRATLDAIGAVEVGMEADAGNAPVSGWALADDLAVTPDPGPSVVLLPALDPAPMGWKDRDWYLGPHGPDLFDRSGNIGPTIWADGHIVGGWAQTGDGAITTALLEPLPSSHQALLDIEVERLDRWLDGTVVKPRFKTPLQQRLVSP
jgi:hypothetical protein